MTSKSRKGLKHDLILSSVIVNVSSSVNAGAQTQQRVLILSVQPIIKFANTFIIPGGGCLLSLHKLLNKTSVFLHISLYFLLFFPFSNVHPLNQFHPLHPHILPIIAFRCYSI